MCLSDVYCQSLQISLALQSFLARFLLVAASISVLVKSFTCTRPDKRQTNNNNKSDYLWVIVFSEQQVLPLGAQRADSKWFAHSLSLCVYKITP